MFVLREHPILILKNRYPQLLLPIEAGISKSDLYKKVVYSGCSVPHDSEEMNFTLSDKDYLSEETFSCGKINILFLNERKDFESFVQKTAYRCEPNEIPKSMGAIMINGLNNWEKIHMSLDIKRNVSHMPNNDPSDSDFFNDKDNYQDSLIVLSSDFYSSLDASYTPYTKEEWLNISLEIRKYHELTHYLCRKKFPTLKNPILDEIFADCMGIIMSVGNYEDDLAKQFLGLEKQEYKKGMRLENYLTPGDKPEDIADKARTLIQRLKAFTVPMKPLKEEFEENINQYYPKSYDLYESIT